MTYKPLLDVLLHIFDDISNIKNTGKASFFFNWFFFRTQPSKLRHNIKMVVMIKKKKFYKMILSKS